MGNGGHVLVTVIDPIDLLLQGRPHRYRLPSHTPANEVTTIPETDHPLGVDLAHRIIRTVDDGGRTVGNGRGLGWSRLAGASKARESWGRNRC